MDSQSFIADTSRLDPIKPANNYIELVEMRLRSLNMSGQIQK